jgi:hypothetical protein
METQQPWMLVDIETDPLFYTQPTQQPMTLYPDDDEGLREVKDTLGPAQAVATDAGVGVAMKKG